MTKTPDYEPVFRMLSPIFRKCVYGTTKYNMMCPFEIGDHVYATDGRIAVRCIPVPRVFKLIGVLRADDDRKPEQIVSFFSEPFRAEGVPVPDLSGVPKCGECEGTGTVKGLYCEDCGCLNRHPAVQSECNECDGCGLGDSKECGMIVAGRVRLSYKYLKTLADAGATLYFPAEGHEGKTRFVCPDGVEGVLMPLKWDVAEGRQAAS